MPGVFLGRPDVYPFFMNEYSVSTLSVKDKHKQKLFNIDISGCTCYNMPDFIGFINRGGLKDAS
jgi:hypothetical protein